MEVKDKKISNLFAWNKVSVKALSINVGRGRDALWCCLGIVMMYPSKWYSTWQGTE